MDILFNDTKMLNVYGRIPRPFLREWPRGVSENTKPSALLASDDVWRCWDAVSWSIGDQNFEVVCACVYCETGTMSLVHGDTFGVSAAEHQFLPFASLDLFVMELSIGDKVFYTRSTGLRVPVEVMLWTMGMWSWSIIEIVSGSSIIDAKWTPSPSFPVSSLHHDHHQWRSVRKSFPTFLVWSLRHHPHQTLPLPLLDVWRPGHLRMV